MKKYIDLSNYDENQTIAQLKKAIEADEILAKQKENEETEKVKKQFSNVYLKQKVEHTLFGKILKVYHLKEYVRSERTTDWELIYYFEGSKMSFSLRDVYNANFNTDRADNSFSAKELEEMTVISKTEYVDYVQHYEQITDRLSNLVNQ
jgi:hypothetical protein